MASLTRKFLKGMQLSDEQVDAIIDVHADVVNSLKEQIDTYKADAEKLPEVQKELKEAKAEVESSKTDSYKVKYEALKEDFDNYKQEQTKKETHEAKVSAYRDLLKSAGVSEKRIDAVLKVSDVDKVKFDNDGKVEGADSILKDIKEEWADFIQTTEAKGAETPKPPANTGGRMSRDEIMQIKDREKRREVIAQNLDLFNKKQGENSNG